MDQIAQTGQGKGGLGTTKTGRGTGSGKSGGQVVVATAGTSSSSGGGQELGDGPSKGTTIEEQMKDLVKAMKRATDAAAKMDDEGLQKALEELGDLPYPIPICADSTAIADAAQAGASISAGDIMRAASIFQSEIDTHSEYEDGDRGRVHVMRSIRTLGNKREYNRAARWVKTNDAASRFIRDALLRSRTGHENVGRYKRHGRLDQKALHRVLSRDLRVFEKKTVESPGRYLVWLMLDHSGSMAGGADRNTAEVAISFVNALQHVPTMRAEVWAWSDAFKRGVYGPGVVRAWKTGQSVSDIAKIVDLPHGGTPDSQVLAWAYRSILKSTRTGETPVILFASDGQGHVRGMKENVEKAKQLGVMVRSVAIGFIDEEDQAEIYGRRGYVPWAGTMTKTARSLANMVARIVSGEER
jgi:hypothetical protein